MSLSLILRPCCLYECFPYQIKAQDSIQYLVNIVIISLIPSFSFNSYPCVFLSFHFQHPPTILRLICWSQMSRGYRFFGDPIDHLPCFLLQRNKMKMTIKLFVELTERTSDILLSEKVTPFFFIVVMQISTPCQNKAYT